MGRSLRERHALRSVSLESLCAGVDCRTLVISHTSDLSEELDKVWQIILKELCADNEAFAGVVGLEGGAKEL